MEAIPRKDVSNRGERPFAGFGFGREKIPGAGRGKEAFGCHGTNDSACRAGVRRSRAAVRAVAAEGGDGDDGTGNECATNAQTAVRDSKKPTGPAFAVRSASWMSFVSAVR
ncbi:DUF397 domain-containing protein [Embleya sp. NPDC055664]